MPTVGGKKYAYTKKGKAAAKKAAFMEAEVASLMVRSWVRLLCCPETPIAH
tara:strand:+ start:348 stop:500 length:153 start_codon:yes stop_codon:yes gene_type:complete